jgi:hypothetical protein
MAACSTVLIATNSSLVGDGSYYLLRAVQTRGPFPLSGRTFSNAIREGPMLIGLASGVTDTHVLTLLEGVGFVLVPTLVWSLTLLLARRSPVQFTLVAVAGGICFASMMLFSVSELTLTLPLAVLASVLLTRRDPWSRTDAVIVLIATGLLVLSHESVVPCAVVVTILAVLRMRAGLGPRDRWVSTGVAVLSVVAALVALWTLAYRPNSNSTDFLTDVENLRPAAILLLMVAGSCLVGWAVLHGRGDAATWIGWALLVPTVGFTLLGVQSAIHAGPAAAYAARGFSVALVVAVQLLLLVNWVLARRSHSAAVPINLPTGAAWGAAAFLVVLMIVPTVGGLRWSTVVGAFRTTITTHTGLVPESRVETPLAATYLWPWTNTTMSVVLRSSADDATVLNTIPDNPIPVYRAQAMLSPTYTWGR